MKVKLTRIQLEAVELITRVMLNENKPVNPAEKLIYDIVYKLYSRIRTRIERATATKDGWSIKFGEQEALAMHVFISNAAIPTGYTYEEVQLQTIYNQLDQEYGRLVCTDSHHRKLAT
ncbi:hypothetical protein [Sphingobacterium sp. LRF_L2]|uniref:hypothetical protein n=1 Tax=Sphingobacterium sp. LRF_L2 TaxID=3369421 RepID=UPI003F5E185D